MPRASKPSKKPSKEPPLKIKDSHVKMKPIFQKNIKIGCQMLSKYCLKGFSAIELLNNKPDKVSLRMIPTLCKSLKETRGPLSLIITENKGRPPNLKLLAHVFNKAAHLKRLQMNSSPTDSNVKETDVKKILSRLSRFKNLERLDLPFGTLTKGVLPCLYRQTKTLRKLQDLQIEIFESRNTQRQNRQNVQNVQNVQQTSTLKFKGPKTLKSLCITLETPDFPSNLTLDLSEYPLIENLRLEWGIRNLLLPPLLPKTRSLQKKKGKSKLNKNQEFLQIAERFKNLTTLDLKIFADFFEEDYEATYFPDFFKTLAYFTNLETLKLDLEVEELFPFEFGDYDNILLLSSLTRLQTISLALSDHPGDGKIPMLHRFCQAFQDLTCLKDFSLYSPEYIINCEELTSLAQMLQRIDTISVLKFTFAHENLDGISLKILFQNIAHLPLSSFLFSVERYDPDPPPYEFTGKPFRTNGRGLGSLFTSLGGFRSLASLDLNLLTFYIDEYHIEGLSSAVKNLEELVHVSIEIFCPRTTAKTLLTSFKKKPELKFLKLVFKGELESEDGELLASILKCCRKNLESLHFDFEASELSAESTKNFTDELRKLSSLKNLTLLLKRKSKFEPIDTAFQLLIAPTFLRSLETIKIQVPYDMEPEDFASLLRNMKNHLHLKTFEVNTDGTFREILA